MKSTIAMASILSAALLVLTSTPGAWAEAPQQEPQPQTEIFFKRLAVAPVFTGHRIPKLDETLDDTLSCKISEICMDDPTIGPGAGTMVTKLVYSTLYHRFGSNLVKTVIKKGQVT